MSIKWAVDAANGSPLPNTAVNVCRDCYTPMVRKPLSAEWITKNEWRWLYWRWIPEAMPDGRKDCGYSGVREDALLQESQENENCAVTGHNAHAGYYQPALSFEA